MLNIKPVLWVALFSALLLCSCNNSNTTIDNLEKNNTGQPELTNPIPEEPETTATQTENAAIKIKDNDLFGFWHSAPDFSTGFQPAYIFYPEGYFIHYKTGNKDYAGGSWHIEENILALDYFIGFEDSPPHIMALDHFAYGSPEISRESHAAELMEKDAGARYPAVIIDNQKYWQKNKPIEIINGAPLYINYDYTFLIPDYQAKSPLRYGDSEDHIIIHSDLDLYNFKILQLDYGDDNRFYVNNTVCSLDTLSSDTYVEYCTTIPEGVPYEAIAFTDADGNAYTYLLMGNDGYSCAGWTEDVIGA